MSDTIVDMAKVTQALDNGWTARLFRNEMGSYSAVGRHRNAKIWQRSRQLCLEAMIKAGWSEEEARSLNDADFTVEGLITTDDFTPEQALTRLAYKVHGEII